MLRLAWPIGYSSPERFRARLEELVGLGFQAVELDGGSVAGHEDEVAAALRAGGLALSAMWGTHVSGAWGDEAAQRADSQRRLRATLDFNARLGGDGVVTIDHQVPSSFTPQERELALGRFAEFVAEAAAYAASIGTCLLIEPLEYACSPLLATTDESVAFCRRIDSPGLRLCLDTYHIEANGEDCAMSIRAARECIGHIHLSDLDLRPGMARRPIPGVGQIAFAPVLRAMNDIGYRGCAMLEGSYPPDQDQRMALRNCVEYLKSAEAGAA